MATDLFGTSGPSSVERPLTVFHAELLGCAQANWEELFDGFSALKAITFSSSIDLLMQLVPRFEDAEIVFGSETILSKEHRALAQASDAVEAYGFADALIDHKALAEALMRLLGRSGRRLIERVVDGSLRFRLLRDRPSHEKLYLLSGPRGHRVVTGSANMSLAAFGGRQQEVYVRFDGEAAWSVFDAYYQRDWTASAPVDADLIVSRGSAADPPTARTTPLELAEVPVVRVLNAGIAIADEPPRPVAAGFTADALKAAAGIGAELRDLALPKDKTGRSVVTAASVLRVIRSHQARPVAEASEDNIPRAEIDMATGAVRVNSTLWLASEHDVPHDAIKADAQLLTDYLESFQSFFGNAEGAIEAYWAFLVWLYAAPTAPHLRQAAIPVGIDPWVYPVYAVLFGRSSGGKTLFTKVAARSMFGFEKMIRSGQFTANRALGLRNRLGAIPLLIDDVTRDKFTSHVPDLVRTDQDTAGVYAPIVLTTNRDVSAIPPDLTKRMVTCHIDAAIPENKSATERIARRTQKQIGTALYRAYLQRLIPEVRRMRAAIDAEVDGFPDLLSVSSAILHDLLGATLGQPPGWAKPIGFEEYFGIRHRRFCDQLADILADAADERITINRRTGELTVSFAGDNNQAGQFARSVPDFVLKGRFADLVKLDLRALEQEMGFSVGRGRGAWWRRLLSR